MKPAALLLIDVQQGLDDPLWGKRNNPQAESNIARLLEVWREHRWPVIHVRHSSVHSDSPLRPGQAGNAFKPEAEPLPGEMQFEKSVNSAFIGTGLEHYLHGQGISVLLVAGLTTDHCVSSSVRMAANLGFRVTLVADATATFDRRTRTGLHYPAELIHNIHLASLDGEFCELRSTAEILVRCS